MRLAIFVPVSVAAALCGTPTADAASQQPDRDVPDVAVVVAGGTGRTTTVRSGEPEFARLWQLLEPMYAGTERVSAAWDEGRHPPVRVTVVWGLTGVGGWPQTNSPPGGDVAMKRQDQLVVAGDGTPWVRSDAAPDVADDDIRWHRAPRSVFERMSRAGLLGAAGDGAAGGAGGTEGPGAAAGGGAWWAIPGLVAGFAAGVGGTLLIRRAAARPGTGPPREEPRQELIDL
ncbi:hypothetical protein ADK57_23930 [Streptomyces sp. MMG1533]|uniref:hypothetical protein n=1 Tax=Streptomyces sp. MMG1533 TaxID=1415546 RepID=UPI0006B060BE|nr:hypothetical protein [Streptomyces sp. MMG1533]KOU62839.1 hypothetical protein ADK57_23930 [Streptomyces sp. MMG1533]